MSLPLYSSSNPQHWAFNLSIPAPPQKITIPQLRHLICLMNGSLPRSPLPLKTTPAHAPCYQSHPRYAVLLASDAVSARRAQSLINPRLEPRKVPYPTCTPSSGGNRLVTSCLMDRSHNVIRLAEGGGRFRSKLGFDASHFRLIP